MGRTLPTATDLLRRGIEEWRPFRAMLPRADRKDFDAMMQSAKLLRYAIMMALPSHPVAFRPMIMAIIFRHYQQLKEVEEALEGTEKE
ncbi:hypothetical protein [Nitrososphaera sp.]|uniref:hypothetical protein n=1 Tax=Nitrososphaera sp. TaxID=1971748 RepID=UPI00183A50C8|nr:hypothetical protein [Nitrososphaera sp.]NWG37822.1 hypothetical protein [Nitrososphaera sp.]